MGCVHLCVCGCQFVDRIGVRGVPIVASILPIFLAVYTLVYSTPSGFSLK